MEVDVPKYLLTIKQLLPDILVALAGTLFVYYPISDGDIFWHLAAGREIISHKAFLYTDPFAFTSANLPWIDLHWLYQVIVYGIDRVCGLDGLLFFNSIAFGGACFIISQAIPCQKGKWLSSLLFAIILYEVKYLEPMRPIVITLLCLSLFIFLLERFIRSRSLKYLLGLLIVQIFWVNSQGLFMIGPAVVFCYFFGELLRSFLMEKYPKNYFYDIACDKDALRSMGLVIPLLFIVSLVNPYGFNGFGLSLKLFSRINPSLANIYSVNIDENIPLLQMLSTGNEHYVILVFALTTLALIGLGCFFRYTRISHILLAGCFLPLAFMAQRNIILFCFAAAPLIVSFAHRLARMELIPAKIRKYAGIAMGSVLVCIVIAAIYKHIELLSKCPPTSLAPFIHPIESTTYIQSHQVPGNGFNADRYGGYLLWKLYPTKKVYIDTRLSIRTRQFFSDYLQLLDNPSLFDSLSATYNLTYTVLPTALTGRYTNLARQLYANPRWRLVVADGAEALFVKDSLAATPAIHLDSIETIDSVARSFSLRWKKPPLITEARLHFGVCLMNMGAYNSAAHVLSSTAGSAASLAYARALDRAGYPDSALALLQKIISDREFGIESRLEMVRVLIDKKEYGQALENAIFVLKRNPFNSQAKQLIQDLGNSN